MRVLFVTPYIYDFTAYDLWLRPLGNLYLASVVQKYSDAEVSWLDALDRFQDDPDAKSGPYGKGKYHRVPVDKPEVYRNIPRKYSRYGIPLSSFKEKLGNLEEPDIIFVTTLMTYWIDGVNFTVKLLRKRFGNATIVTGGILPTLLGDTVKNYIDSDLFLSGYGETGILELLKSRGATVKTIPDFGKIDNIPFPANHFLSNRKVLPLLTSRGCPYNCTYCASGILNPRFLQRSSENISEEIGEMYQKFGTEDFIIFDDAFLINKRERFFPVFREVGKRRNIRFHTPNGIHAAELDEETAGILYAAGFKTVRLSFESTDDSVLQASSHKVNTDQMIKAVNNLNKAGYKKNEIECYILFGFPGQSPEMLERSLHFVGELGILPRLSTFSPVPGTAEFKRLKGMGLMRGEDFLYRTNKLFFLYSHSGLTVSQIRYFESLARNTCLSAETDEN